MVVAAPKTENIRRDEAGQSIICHFVYCDSNITAFVLDPPLSFRKNVCKMLRPTKVKTFRGQTLSAQKGLFGDDGWFFLGNEFDKEYDQALRTHSPDEIVLEGWARSLQYMTDVLARRKIESFFLLVPGKWSVYEDKLPLQEAARSKKTSRQHLKEILKGSRVNFVDPTEEMKRARAIADTFSPLNSHWNNFGALIGWRTLHEAIKNALPHVALPPIPSIARIEEVDNFNEAANILGYRAPNPWHRPVFASELNVYDYILPGYTKSPQHGHREIDLLELPVITECPLAPNDARALILRDSTGNQISPFIQTSFRSVLQHRHRYDDRSTYSNVLGPVREFGPDLLVYLLTERYLIHNFLDAAYWETANNFDLIGNTMAAVWPKEPDKPLLQFFQNYTPGVPSIIKLPCSPNSEACYINVSVRCTSTGVMRLSYVENNEKIEKTFPLDAALNELFLKATGNSISLEIIGSEGISSFIITRIEARYGVNGT